jgi:cellobiose-specific phosphotransferase system component IIA
MKTERVKKRPSKRLIAQLQKARAALTEAHDIVTKAIPEEPEVNKKWLLRNTKKHIQDAQYSLEGAL